MALKQTTTRRVAFTAAAWLVAFLIYSQALIQFDVGNASAGGLVAVVIANIVAFFLVRIIGRNLEA